MKLLFFLISVLNLVGFGTYVWLTVTGFKRSTLWGFLILLLSPFSAIVFAVKYWDEAKKPFLSFMGCMVASVALLFMTFGTMGGFAMMSMADRMSEGQVSEQEMAQFIEQQMDRMENSGLLDDQEQQELNKMRGMLGDIQQEGQGEGTPSPTTVVSLGNDDLNILDDLAWLPAGATPTAAGSTAKIPIGEVAPGEADKLLGALVRIVEKGGKIHRVTLTDVKRDNLYVERHLVSGTFAYPIRKRDVESLMAL